MLRGDKEQKCLDFVKSNIKFENYYGFTKVDIEKFKKCLNSAKSNPNSSEFPDFICDNGFIEHFQVTSGKTTRKGSEHLKNFNQYQSKIRKDIEKEIANCENGNLEPYYSRFKYPKHSYGYLKKSIKENWLNHIKSLDNYTGNKNIGIFMIEYQDSTIEMIENIYADWKNGVSCGNLRQQQQLDYYSICRDKEILNYLYEYRKNIKYIIYKYSKGVELVKLENIPEINKLFPWDFCIAPLQGTIRIDTYIPIPNIIEENKNE